MGRLADRYGRAFVMKCQSLLVAAACAGLMLKGGLMAPSLIALGWPDFPCTLLPWPGDARKLPGMNW